jgi:hypothetical protein
MNITHSEYCHFIFGANQYVLLGLVSPGQNNRFLTSPYTRVGTHQVKQFKIEKVPDTIDLPVEYGVVKLPRRCGKSLDKVDFR